MAGPRLLPLSYRQQLSRHPRFSIALFVLLAVTFLFLVEGWSSADDGYDVTASQTLGHRRRPHGWTKALLAESEVEHRRIVNERHALVAVHGPSAENIVSFPEKNLLYTLWDFFIPNPTACPHRIERVGTLGDGGKWVCGLDVLAAAKPSTAGQHRPKQPSAKMDRTAVEQTNEKPPPPPCVVYSIGINGESSFEAALLERATHCEVFGYDFSVSSMGPEVFENTAIADRAHFWPYMLAGEDDHTASPPKWTLASLMAKNGHGFVDVLKVDIEGSEFETLEALLRQFVPSVAEGEATSPRRDEYLPFGQLQLEIHARVAPYDTFPGFLGWWEKLERAGLRAFFTEPNLVYVNHLKSVANLAEYSFINVRGQHKLLR